MNGEKGNNRFLLTASRLFCRLDYYCRFGMTLSPLFFIIYNVVLVFIFIFLWIFSGVLHIRLQGLGRLLILCYAIVGFIFATISSIIFEKNQLRLYHKFRSFAGSSYVKQIDKKRKEVGCVGLIIDFLLFFILLFFPMLINVSIILLIT